MKKILAAVDGSEQSVRAATMAAGLATGFGARLTLAYACAPVIYPIEAGWVPSPELEKAQRRAGEEALAQVKQKVARPNLNVDTVLVDGTPAEAIADHAEKNGYDLTVVGSRGRGAVARVLLGSVADRLVHISKAPVLVVR